MASYSMRSASVRSLELAAPADFAVLVPGQRLDDEMARLAADHSAIDTVNAKTVSTADSGNALKTSAAGPDE